jgi:hypothetical protein
MKKLSRIKINEGYTNTLTKTISAEELLTHLYRVHQEEHPSRIDTLTDIYLSFRNNWPSQVMNWVKAYKATVFDTHKKLLGSVYFEPNERLKEKHVRMLFKVIDNQVENAATVRIARNPAGKAMEPDDFEKTMAGLFDKYAKENGLLVEGHYAINQMGMYKFKKHDIIKTIEEDGLHAGA